ncbi:hypothetical protein I4U23_000908 [Adineta vaga]|nr:hypothetical protein I4U23_000908 [Adineta vaga]
MNTNLDQQLETIERNSKGWKTLTFYDRSLLQQLTTCLQSCLTIISDNTFLNIVINRRPQVFDMFECIATHLFKQWKHQKRSLTTEQLNFLTIVGTFNRRIALTLQNDNDDPYSNEDDNEQKDNNLEHQKRVRELLFDNNENLFDILMEILPSISENDVNFIEMILSWYESYIFFEHSYIDSTLDEKFHLFYNQIIQCLKSKGYERSLLIFDHHQILITTVRHRFYLVRQIIRIDENYISKLEHLINHAQNIGNRRIAIMTQLFLLILTSCTKHEDLSQKFFLLCLTYIQMSLDNTYSYHYNRIPMSLFFKSIIHIMKDESIQDIIAKHYLNLLTNLIINYQENHLHDNLIYRECTMITCTLLWSLSFNETIRKILKQYDDKFFHILQTINTNTNEIFVKQATCGLLYNLDRLDFDKNCSITDHNFGKTIGISYDISDQETVQMIEQELNKNGHRVWTNYDHMNDQFIPSFISLMNSTEYLIICLSDMYRMNNRCRTELLYATTSGCCVLSWKVQIPTENSEENEQIRIRAIEILLKRITPIDKNTISSTDITHVTVHMEKRSTPTNFNRRRRTKEIMNLENWTTTEVSRWCQSLNIPGFSKLITNFDGQSVVKLYEFCKQNSTETIAILNNDLHHICEQENISDIQISLHEFIRFQIEVEKVITSSELASSSLSLTSLKPEIYKKRLKIRTCSIL